MVSELREHFPHEQVKAMQFCFSADKRPLGFFLGAGCPLSILVDGESGKEPLIQDVRGLTKRIAAKLDSDGNYKPLLTALTTLCAEDGCKDPTIEDFLNRLRNIQAIGGGSAVRGITPGQAKEADRKVCRLLADEVGKELPKAETPYHALVRWIRGTPRSAPVEVFTPNYDLLFEQAFERTGVPYFDGFVGSRRAFLDVESMEKDVLPPRWARLWKLHGSINWGRNEAGDVWRGAENQEEGMLIYPSHEKYTQSRQMPFLAMLDRLKSFLNRPGAALAVCGYSFIDEHFNALLREGLRGNSTAVIFALVFENLSNDHAAISLAEEAPNFLVLAKDAAVIGGNRRNWKIGSDSTTPATFTLGDFGEFGRFLASVSGQSPAPTPS